MTEGINYTTMLVFMDDGKEVIRVLPTLVSMVKGDSIEASKPIGGRTPTVLAGPYAPTEDTVREGVYEVSSVRRGWTEDEDSCSFEVKYYLGRNTRR